jgi:oligoendopeptidase F
MTDIATITRELDDRFLEIHYRKESAFWKTRMGTADESARHAKAEIEMKRFMSDTATLETLRSLDDSAGDGPERTVLRGWIQTLERSAIRTAEGRKLYEENVEAERALVNARTEMRLGYVEPSTGEFKRASSVALSNGMLTSSNEAFRRACREGKQSIEAFVLANGYPEIVKLRNRFARAEGYPDFYEYKVRTGEGFGKETVFRLLDDLEVRTRDHARAGHERLAAEKGDAAIRPWNFGYNVGGSLAGEREPYFRFEDALERWIRSFAALGIRYAGAQLTLDLIERKGKYENGFMHGPRPAYQRNGEWQPAEINFTANAIPNKVGSGQRAARTLFHEGGHAAHFANIRQGSPCFSNEFNISVVLAETQSMFLDSLLSDADWQTRYARDGDGTPIPFAVLEKGIRTSRPHVAHYLRSMMSICYAEKEIYELSDEEVTADRLTEIARGVESRMHQLDGGAPDPILSIPHVLSWESSAYYHGYVLARMAVEQTREHFEESYGHLLDNPRIGPDLARVYWAPGGARPALELIEELTGKPLSADALVRQATRSVDEGIERAKRKIERLPEIPAFEETPDLDMRLRIVHGDEVVVEEGTPYEEAVAQFRAWVQKGWPREEG